jgi:phage shock protein PspC (stress-responsive transcriptional regulator)
MVRRPAVAQDRAMTTQTPAGDGPVPPGGPGPGAPGATAHPNGFFQQIRRTGLYRSEERWIGGVAGGLAARFGLDPLLMRGLFLVTLLLGGFGLVIYALGWAFLPEERDGRIHLEGLVLGHPDIALLGALGLFIAGVGRGAWNDWPLRVPDWLQGMFWAGAAVLVVVLVVTLLSPHRRQQPRPYPGPGAAPTPPFSPVPPASPVTPPAAPFTGPAGRGGPAASAAAWTPPPASPAAASPAAASPAAAWTSTEPRATQPVYSAQPYRYAPAPVPPPRPKPPRPPRYGPGATTVGVTIALALFVIAGVLIADRVGWLDRPTLATAAAAIVLIFGVAIIVAGLRGRTSGVLGFLAVVAMLVATPIAVTANSDTNPWIVDSNGIHVTTTEGTTTITDRTTASDGYTMGFGNATLDLTRVPLSSRDRLTVPVDVSAGNLVVVVPEGAAVAARADVAAGQVTWRVGGDYASASGVGRRDDFGVPADEAALWLQIHVGAGNVTIEEGTR